MEMKSQDVCEYCLKFICISRMSSRYPNDCYAKVYESE